MLVRCITRLIKKSRIRKCRCLISILSICALTILMMLPSSLNINCGTNSSCIDIMTNIMNGIHINTSLYIPASPQNAINLSVHLSGANDFINITRLRNKALFEIIEEDDLPSSNWSYYKENITSVNYLNYSFLITGEDICITEPAFLLIIIPSTINQTDHRDLIRKTWLRAAETNAWPRREIRDKIKHIFLFGSSAKSRTKDLEKLTIESFINRDIVMADFEDTYRNLTTKMLVGLKWTLKYCSHVQYVIKVDMDTVINVPLMLNLLHHIEENITSKTFLLGRQHGSKKPLVERSKKRWKVSQSEFPLVYYPRYLYGHTYVLSIASLEILLSASHNKPLIAPEDAFITGILPKLTGILRLNSPSFALCCRIILDCEVVWNEKVAITDAKTKEVSEKLWINIVKNTCNKNVSIRIKDYIMQ